MVSRNNITKLALEGLLEESVEELYDNAPCGYFSTLPDGTFIKINNTFQTWLEYDAKQLLFVKKIQDLLPIGDAIYYETHYYPLLQMQGFINEINFSLRASSGKLLPVLLNTTLVRDLQGRPALYRTTVFNITDRKKYELELLKAKKKAEDAARVKAEFLSTVSHEIRTPINAIVGIVHLMRNTTLSPQQAEYLSVLELSTENLLKLINNILDFNKIEAGKVSLDEESVAIRDLVASILHGFEARAEANGLTIKYEIDEQIPEHLFVDPLKLVQVLNNLISNALKFTEHGHVAVKITQKKQVRDRVSIGFEVADTGIGIAPDKQKIIFEDFAQANSYINRTYGGTGLGLAISQRLLALYNSELKVESEQGKGSRFYFNLELKVSKEAAKATLQQTETNTAKGVRLLLVEDNKINVYVLSQYLTNWGVRYDVVGNGQEAIEKVIRYDYDLILMDLQMPVMDGYEATRRIRSMEDGKYAKIPIVALTASAQAEYQGKLEESGMNGILAKPFNPSILYKLIASYSSGPLSEEEREKNVVQHHDKTQGPFNLSTFNDLMSDDPEGMLELITITISALQEASVEITKAIKERNSQSYNYWVQNIETSLELLHAKPLHAALEHGTILLRAVPLDPDQLELVEHLIGTQFRLILKGLDERLQTG